MRRLFQRKKARHDGLVWYIPHHGVYHPKKPGNIRVVFDCSADYKKQLFNRHLLQRPDLANSLIGVLSRFRQEDVAFVCDISAMYHQVHVTPKYRDSLRFLWWKNGYLEKEVIEYGMTVHLFRATSSQSVANFTLKKTADDNDLEFGSEAANFLKQDFYVDDGLKSVPTITEAEAIHLADKTKANVHKRWIYVT